jgi:hypothetical protein
MRFALTLGAALALVSVARAQEPKGGAPPRRLLFVQIADYLFVNPLTHAAPGGPDRTREAAVRLAAALRVPNAKDNDQLFVLSDALAADARPTTRDALAKAVKDFCATTRAQDRVVIYFAAHAIEKDGKAFVLPVDGDPDAPAALLPVDAVYEPLKELKASQKVVIWDVCRANPERVRGRRDPGPMTPALFKALKAGPAGVQILIGCSPGERGLEYFTPRGPAGAIPGSAYLDALRQAAADESALDPTAPPGSEIPVDAIHRAALKLIAATTKGQTPALASRLGPRAADYDPKEAVAKRFELPAAPKALPDVKAIFDELALPALVDGDGAPAKVPFAEAALKGYEADVSVDDIFKDVNKYPLRAATLRALQAVRNRWRFNGREQLAVGTVPAPVSAQSKKTATAAQDAVARALIDLELELAHLDAVAGKRGTETKRWQANYDYAAAELRLRLVLLNEYNRALGHVKTEALPDLPPGGAGWRLVPASKIEGPKDLRAMAAEADDGFARLAADHPGTPWELLAKRDRATLPGARWEPFALPKSDKK